MALSKFGKAFAEARKSGKKEFSFGGKSYNTKLKEDGPKKVPTPTAKPAQVKAKASAGASKPAEAKASVTAKAESKKIFTREKPASYTERSKTPAKREAQGPIPMKDVGIARKGSAISKYKAKLDNTPVKKK